MKTCSQCGKQFPDEYDFCMHCGAQYAAAPTPQQAPAPYYQQPYQPIPAPADVPNTGMNVLSCFFPVVGIILYFVWKDQTPNKAKKALKWGLIGFAASIAIGLIYGIIIGLAGL